MYTVLECGPFLMGDAAKYQVNFAHNLQITDHDDKLIFGYGFNAIGEDYRWREWTGEQDWGLYELTLTMPATSTGKIWFRLVFLSDEDEQVSEGPWVDELRISRYNRPARVCGERPSGDKGIVLPAFEPVGDLGYFPVIRSGRPQILQGLQALGVDMVRIPLEIKPGESGLDFHAFDQIVDTLCAEDIGVLFVLNHQSLFRQDFNDENTAVDYRRAFTGTAMAVTEHFSGRVSHFEIWNEADYNPGASAGLDLPPHITEELYTFLFEDTARTIKETNPNAKVLYGGLSTAWGGSFNYFNLTYSAISSALIDIVANHTYPDPNQGPPGSPEASLDPSIYMFATNDSKFRLILDRFLEVMVVNGHLLWITEIGWNTAPASLSDCMADKVVSERQQADYLTAVFDILFNEVTVWGEDTPAVEVVFWYQYRDVGIEKTTVCPVGLKAARGLVPGGYVPLSYPSTSPQEAIPWWFGLYRGDGITAKPAQCAFKMYPETCHYILLPTLKKGGE